MSPERNRRRRTPLIVLSVRLDNGSFESSLTCHPDAPPKEKAEVMNAWFELMDKAARLAAATR